MGPLHIVNKSPYSSRTLERCIARLEPGGALLLVEDGLYAALAGGAYERLMTQVAKSVQVYVLAPHLNGRGLGGKPLHPDVVPIDYARFVDLAEAHSPVITWS
jgi:tRNA 2-thiouridine synthesizing protein B